MLSRDKHTIDPASIYSAFRFVGYTKRHFERGLDWVEDLPFRQTYQIDFAMRASSLKLPGPGTASDSLIKDIKQGRNACRNARLGFCLTLRPFHVQYFRIVKQHILSKANSATRTGLVV